MLTTYSNELFRIAAAASDVGVVDWIKIFALSGVYATIIRVTASKLELLGHFGSAS